MFEETKPTWKRYRRRPDAAHVLPEILVSFEPDGSPTLALPKRPEIQCATPDRIPFTLGPSKLEALFEPVPE
jgi:hypothetical protein